MGKSIKRALAPDDLRRLHSLVKRIGEPAARERTQLAPNTLARALAGLPLQRGTISLVQTGLEKGER